MFRRTHCLFIALGLMGSLTSVDSMLPSEANSQEVLEGVPSAPGEGGPRAWEVYQASNGLNLRGKPSQSADVLRRYAAGSILNNLGCEQGEDRVWCYVQGLWGGPVGYVAAEFLRPAVGPDGSVPVGPDQSAYRAGQGDFDATGSIPCSQASGQPMRECSFGVSRDTGGFATVVVTKPDGVKRSIFFSLGFAIGADTSQADGYPEFTYEKESDLHFVRIGGERYEIPEAVVLGG